MPTMIATILGLWLAAWPSGATPPALSSPDPARANAALSSSVAAIEKPAGLLDLDDDELRERAAVDPASLGSLSIGAPGSAILYNPVQLQPSGEWAIAPRSESWGTSETLAAIETAIHTVNELFPDTPPLFVGDISSADGGRLKRHDSHQGGRDVDFGFYYLPGRGTWYTPGRAGNLDIARNWALLRALLTRTDVEVIFLDTRIQRLLYRHALSIGEDPAWLDRVFQCSRWSRTAIVRHLPGHRTHYHVRFFNPVAQELGRRAHPLLVQLQLNRPARVHGAARRPQRRDPRAPLPALRRVGGNNPTGQRPVLDAAPCRPGLPHPGARTRSPGGTAGRAVPHAVPRHTGKPASPRLAHLRLVVPGETAAAGGRRAGALFRGAAAVARRTTAVAWRP